MHLAIILYQLLVFCTAGLFCILFLIAHRHFGGSPTNLQVELRAYLSGETDEKPDGKFGLLYAYVNVLGCTVALLLQRVQDYVYHLLRGVILLTGVWYRDYLSVEYFALAANRQRFEANASRFYPW